MSEEHAKAAIRAARAMLAWRHYDENTFIDDFDLERFHDLEWRMQDALYAFKVLDQDERRKEATRRGVDGGG